MAWNLHSCPKIIQNPKTPQFESSARIKLLYFTSFISIHHNYLVIINLKVLVFNYLESKSASLRQSIFSLPLSSTACPGFLQLARSVLLLPPAKPHTEVAGNNLLIKPLQLCRKEQDGTPCRLSSLSQI